MIIVDEWFTFYGATIVTLLFYIATMCYNTIIENQ